MGSSTRPLSKKRQDLFCAELRKHGNVTRAAEAIKVTRRGAYRKRDRDPDFFEAWDDAVQAFDDNLESEAMRRAAVGVKRKVYYKGKEIAGSEYSEYSDRLMEFLLDRRRYPSKSKLEHTGKDGGAIEVREIVDLIVDPLKPGG